MPKSFYKIWGWLSRKSDKYPSLRWLMWGFWWLDKNARLRQAKKARIAREKYMKAEGLDKLTRDEVIDRYYSHWCRDGHKMKHLL